MQQSADREFHQLEVSPDSFSGGGINLSRGRKKSKNGDKQYYAVSRPRGW
jgi:hypothetical protein